MKMIAFTIISLLQMAQGEAQASVTKAEFDSVIVQVSTMFTPKFASATNLKLVIDGRWEDPSVNAYSTKLGEKYLLVVSGGIARHPLMNTDGLALVVCHEMGHGLGGKGDATSTRGWATSEGQSDYYGTAKCLKKVFESDDNTAIIKDLDIPIVVRNKCSEAYTGRPKDFSLCVRSALTGIRLGELLNSLDAKASPISVNTPSKTEVTVTSKSHLPSQCRLDTFFAGALCDSNLEDDHDLDFGYCDSGSIGSRPACWFKSGN